MGWEERQALEMMQAPRRVALIACGKSKLDHPAPARDLYTGALFRKSLAFAETTCADVWVLSAKHHLLALDTVTAPYDEALCHMDKRARQLWGFRTTLRLFDHYKGKRTEFVFLAGELYRENALEDMRRYSPVWTWQVPLEGLGIGQQLHKLGKVSNG